jgi:G:T-mismatch repair DNA endonuclease (very short patch repair protein)
MENFFKKLKKIVKPKENKTSKMKKNSKSPQQSLSPTAGTSHDLTTAPHSSPPPPSPETAQAAPSPETAQAEPLESTSHEANTGQPDEFTKNLYKKPTTLIRDKSDNLEITVLQRELRQNHKFKLTDHLYELKVKEMKNSGSDKGTLIFDLFDLFEKSLIKLINTLKSTYKEDNNHLIYITVVKKEIFHGINTGSIPLQTNSKQIANIVLNMLDNYLQSNKQAKVSSDFGFHIKVLNIPHLQHLQNIKKRNKNAKFGIKAKKMKPDNSSTFTKDIPVGCPERQKVFENHCLMVASIFSKMQLNLNEFCSPQIERKSKSILYGNFQNSFQDLLNEFSYLQSQLNLDTLPPYQPEQILPQIAKIYNCQFIILKAEPTLQAIYEYPEKISMNKPILWLLATTTRAELFHVQAITNLKSFFKKYKQYCPFCKRVFKVNTKYSQHRCQFLKSCRSCRLVFKTEETYLNKENENDFCNGMLIKDKMSITCEICGETSFSKECEASHFCKRSFYCHLCNCRTTVGGRTGTFNYIKENHNCQFKCRICNKMDNCRESHLCEISKPSLQKNYSKLAVLEILNNVLTNTPNVLVYYREKTEHEKFIGEIITDKSLNRKETKLSKDINYFSETKLTLTEMDILPCDFPLQTYFGRNLKRINFERQEKEYNILEEFVITIYNDQTWENTTILVQNNRSLFTIANYLLKLQLKPYVLRDNNTIILIRVPNRRIRFLNIKQFDFSSLKEKAKQLGLAFKSFPLLINHEGNYLLTGDSLTLADFCELDYSNDDMMAIKEELKNLNANWRYDEKLVEFGLQNAQILLQFACKTLQETFQFQRELFFNENFSLTAAESEEKKPLFHVFSDPFCSLNSFYYDLYKLVYNYNLFTMKKADTGQGSKSSRPEIKFAQYLQFCNPKKTYRSQLHPLGQKVLTFRQYPDIYDENDNIAYYFQGCYYHGCTRKTCSVFQKYNELELETAIEKQRKFERQMSKLKADNPFVSKIEVIYECEFQEQCLDTSNEKLQYFLKNVFVDRPSTRLVPRDSFRAGRVEMYRAITVQSQNSSIQYMDCSSLYPYCAINNPFPTGKYCILIGKELENMVWNSENKGFFISNKKFIGLAHVKVYPPDPSSLKLAYLPFQARGNNKQNQPHQTVYAFCGACAKLERQGICGHKQESRSFTTTYTSFEINEAYKLNYFFKFYEVYQYDTEEYIFTNYLKHLASRKIRYSGFPEHLQTKTEKEQYCIEVNKEMEFSNSSLTFENVKKDSFKREKAKCALNMFLGKFSQKVNKSKTIYIKTRQELEKIYLDKNISVTNIDYIDDNFCCVTTESKRKNVTNYKGNFIYSAFVTAYSRHFMFYKMMELISSGCTINFINCDSICFTLPNNIPSPLKTSQIFGCFKPQYEDADIKGFFCLGTKNFAIVYLNRKNGETVNTFRISGLSTTSFITQSQLAINEYIILVAQRFENYKIEIKVPQIKTVCNGLTLSKQMQMFTLRSNPYRQGYICEDETRCNHICYPFGIRKRVYYRST